MLARRFSRRAHRASLIALGAALVCAMSVVVPPPSATAATVWTKNLYVSSGFLYQDPYYTACVSAATMMMLNFSHLSDTGGDGFDWATTRVQRDPDTANESDMTSILAFARRYDTLSSRGDGSDPHGWRNALNYYGWGPDAVVDPSLRVYDDRAYSSFTSAVKAAVRAIARHDKPVGILGSAGGHAQVMTGYVAVGDDPATSTSFTVTYVYLSDPLRSRDIRNKKVAISSFQSGSLRYRFRRYAYTDSPHDDPYTSGWRFSSVSPSRGPSEWYGRWVIVLPIRDGVPRARSAPASTAQPFAAPTP